VKIRWFGLLVGFAFVNLANPGEGRTLTLNSILALGAVYTLLDTFWSCRGQVFLGRFPLVISLMEALFIGLLCYFYGGVESPFRYYYFLSLICCAIRYPEPFTYATCALHCASYSALLVALPDAQGPPLGPMLTLIVLGWVTWASSALATLLKRAGEHLSRLNAALRENQSDLEARIAERTRQLQEAQAHVLHQEKMAAFGLLAAGIAHEVGNPLTSISSLVQMLQRRDCDAYTGAKLALVNGQLKRIQAILRELTNFSRPASSARTRVALADILDEALNIAKYYKRIKGRSIALALPADLPPLLGVRDQLVQVFLNLVLNAIDATQKGGRIELHAERRQGELWVTVRDDGSGIETEQARKLFQPYFTTKPHGTGLGLFVSRKLVQDHGGTLDFESQPGQGTQFLVRLPLPEEASQGDRGQETEDRGQRTEGREPVGIDKETRQQIETNRSDLPVFLSSVLCLLSSVPCPLSSGLLLPGGA
jgi:signal transduction histidine kinase